VAHLFTALRYKSEGRGFDSRWGHRILTCQRLIFRLIGVPLGKSVTSQRNRNAPDFVTRRYGNGNMAEHTTTWPPELASHMLL
jgi:hypothetical protein